MQNTSCTIMNIHNRIHIEATIHNSTLRVRRWADDQQTLSKTQKQNQEQNRMYKKVIKNV